MNRRNRDRRSRKGSNTDKRKRDGMNRYRRSNTDRVRKTGTEGTGIEVQEQGLKKQG